MPGPSDISAILSQGGRIEKITQGSFVHPDVAKQVLTEEEARERVRRNREVNEPQKGLEITARERGGRRGSADDRRKHPDGGSDDSPDEPSEDGARKHLIDVVI